MTQRLTINLPWPDSRLSPNKKDGRHWGSTRDAKLDAGKIADLLTRQAMSTNKYQSAEGIPVRIMFHEPNKIRRDLDGLLSSLKPSLDAIAKRLGVDDSQFYPILLDRTLDPKGFGYVAVSLDLHLVDD